MTNQVICAWISYLAQLLYMYKLSAVPADSAELISTVLLAQCQL